ncbi:hypothetical protein [Nesterenkonia alba]|uniref:hypothetical protein n=1 Tax=Nesterenkonia alba TaxID=515814 RepID=UPI0004069F02|nr:hypothetical protein [Nesterenkonia alba]
MLWRSIFWFHPAEHTDRASSPSTASPPQPAARTAAGTGGHATAAEPSEVSYAVVVDYLSFGTNGGYVAQLYRNGKHHAYAELPAAFPVPGGVIEVAASMVGLKRVHYVPDDDGDTRQEGQLLTPEPRSAEGLRAQLGEKWPRLGAWLSRGAIVVLIIALVLSIPQMVELVTRWDVVQQYVGTWTSPVNLPAWLNTVVAIAGALAAFERVLTVRYNWLLDGGEDFGDLGFD